MSLRTFQSNHRRFENITLTRCWRGTLRIPPQAREPCCDPLSAATVEWRKHVQSIPDLSPDCLLKSFIAYHILPEITYHELHTIVGDCLRQEDDASKWPAYLVTRIRSSVCGADSAVSEISMQVLVEELRRYILVAGLRTAQIIICDTGPGPDLDKADPGDESGLSIHHIISEVKHQTRNATGYTPNNDIAWELLDTAARQLEQLIDRSIISDLQQIPLRVAYAPSCNPGPRMPKTALPESDLGNELRVQLDAQEARVNRHLRRQGFDIRRFSGYTRAQICRLSAQAQLFYQDEVHRVMGLNLVIPSHVRSVDEQVAKVSRLVRSFFTFRYTVAVPLGPHQVYVEGFTRLHYSGYLTRNQSSNFLDNGYPSELVVLILQYAFGDPIELRPPPPRGMRGRPGRYRNCDPDTDTWRVTSWDWDGLRYSGAERGGRHPYWQLCLTSRPAQKVAQQVLMSQASLKIDFNRAIDMQQLEYIRESAGPPLNALDRARPIRASLFSHIRTLHLALPKSDRAPSIQSTRLFSLLDSLTGLKTVHLHFGARFNARVWSSRGQVEGWVVQLLARIRPGVCLTTQTPTLDRYRTMSNHTYSSTVFLAWVDVVRRALAVDRSTPGAREAARLAGNPLSTKPDAYLYEWRDNMVRLQQAVLRAGGFAEFAEILGETGPLPYGFSDLLQEPRFVDG